MYNIFFHTNYHGGLMNREYVIIHFYCVIDDFFKSVDQPSRPGKKTMLSDAEALTIEMAGEFFGMYRDT